MAETFIQVKGRERSTPTTLPDANHLSLYPKSDNSWYSLDSAGNEVKLSNPAPGVDAPSVYRATLVGANGSLTSTTVGKSDFTGVTITGAYVSEGVYTLTAGSAIFTAGGKTTPLISAGTATGGVTLKAEVTSTTVITLRAFAADGTTASDAIGTFFVHITVDV